MAKIELIMPKMGESVSEATIITWNKEIGDTVELDETIIEIATVKVDSEVPSSHEGKLIEKLFAVDDIVQVGKPFAILETEGEENNTSIDSKTSNIKEQTTKERAIEHTKPSEDNTTKINEKIKNIGEKFYSPLVRSIASKENINISELDNINGTGKNGRVTKVDIISYIENRKKSVESISQEKTKETTEDLHNQKATNTPSQSTQNFANTGEYEIVEMDRMRKIISSHMTMSKQTSAHITSFVEADMTNIVKWRNSIKEDFKNREKQNITFTPIIIEAMAKAVKDFPMINVSVIVTSP